MQAMRFARSLQSSGNKPIAVSFGNASHTEWPEDDVTVLLDLAENFLSRCLGGVARPLDKELIAKSSMRVAIRRRHDTRLEDSGARRPLQRHLAGGRIPPITRL